MREGGLTAAAMTLTLRLAGTSRTTPPWRDSQRQPAKARSARHKNRITRAIVRGKNDAKTYAAGEQDFRGRHRGHRLTASPRGKSRRIIFLRKLLNI